MTLVAIILILILVSLAILFILRRLMKKYASSATAHLEQLSQDYVLRQEELRGRLEEADKRYQDQLSRAAKEVDHMKAKAVQAAEAEKVQILEQARREGEAIVQKAIDTRDAVRKEIESELESRAVQHACEMFRGLLPESVKREAQRAWEHELLEQRLPEAMNHPQAKSIRSAHLVTAGSLSEEEFAALAGRIKAKIGNGAEVTHAVDGNLVAGMILNIGFMVLDGSLASKLRAAARKTIEGMD